MPPSPRPGDGRFFASLCFWTCGRLPKMAKRPRKVAQRAVGIRAFAARGAWAICVEADSKKTGAFPDLVPRKKPIKDLAIFRVVNSETLIVRWTRNASERRCNEDCVACVDGDNRESSAVEIRRRETPKSSAGTC